MQNAFCHQKRRFATRFRETVITGRVLQKNDSKRILSQIRRFGTRFRETVITNPILRQNDGKLICSAETLFWH